jgi:hypothetical protein
MTLRQKLYSTSILKRITAAGMILLLTVCTISSCQEKDEFIPLKIFSVEPPEALIGDTITIIGEGFSPGYNYNEVLFPGAVEIVQPFPTSSKTRLQVQVPDGAHSGPINVSILDQESASSPALNIAAPVIENITPPTAWIGDTVLISGQNFRLELDKNNVKFNPENPGQTATVVSSSSTALRVVIPTSTRDGAISILGYAGPEFKIRPPEIVSITPEQAVVGETISIKGRGLNNELGTVTISFSGVNATADLLPESTPSDLRVAVPENAIDGAVTMRYGTTEVTSPIVLKVFPSIRDLFPRSGVAGSRIKISGYKFSIKPEENIVTFNGVQATVTKSTEKELQVVVADGTTSGPVRVTVSDRVANGPVFAISAAGTPLVYELQPDRGPVTSMLVLKGENFSAVAVENEVRFTGDKIAAILSATEDELIVRVPEGAENGAITVTKEGKVGVSPDFTLATKAVPVITSVSPGQIMRGATLTIKGGNFNVTEDLYVQFGSAASTRPTEASENEIKVVVPSDGINPGEYSVRVSQSGETSNDDKVIQVQAQPVIANINPIQGTPGAVVTLTGTDFDFTESGNTVKFGNTVAQLSNPNDPLPEKVSAFIPDLSPGVYNVTITAFDNVSNPFSFTVKEKPVAVKNVFYAVLADGSTAVRLQKATFDPPSITPVYTTLNGGSVSNFVIDISANKVYIGESGELNKSNLNNTGKVELYNVEETGSGITDLSLDISDGFLFWSNLSSIYKGNVEGSGAPELLFDANDGLDYLQGLTYLPDNNKLYLTDINFTTGATTIFSANADGSETPSVLFDSSDGLRIPYDIKIDFASGKIFLLDMTDAGSYRILSGNLDGTGSLTELKDLGVLALEGIALDIQDSYIYWIQSEEDGVTYNIYRAKYDFSVIPGTNPESSIQEVYSNIPIASTLDGFGGLAIEESSKGGGSQRVKSLRVPLKFKIQKPK